MDINEVMSGLGIEGKRSGNWTFYLCPFHNEKEPSFAVKNEDPSWGYCFSCGRSATADAVYAELHGVSLEEARRALGLPVRDREKPLSRGVRVMRFLKEASEELWERNHRDFEGFIAQKLPYLEKQKSRFFPLLLANKKDVAYLVKGLKDVFGLEDDAFRKLYALSGRVVFPFLEPGTGDVFLWGFVGRAFGETSKKYVSVGLDLYEKKLSTRPLFLSWMPPSRGKLFLVEGITDALCARAHNIPAVAAAGSVGVSVVEPFKRYLQAWKQVGLRRVFFVPDADNGGNSAMVNAVQKLKEICKVAGVIPWVVLLKEGQDLDDFLLGGGRIEELETVGLEKYLHSLSRPIVQAAGPAETSVSGEQGSTPASGAGLLEAAKRGLRLKQLELAEKAFEKLLEMGDEGLSFVYQFFEDLSPDDRTRFIKFATKKLGVSPGGFRERLLTVCIEKILRTGKQEEVILHPVMDYKKGIASVGFTVRFSFFDEIVEKDFFIVSYPMRKGVVVKVVPEFRFELPALGIKKVSFQEPKYGLPDLEEVVGNDWVARFMDDLTFMRMDSYVPAVVFQDVRRVFNKYLYVEQDIFLDVLAAYAMLTYFHQVFWSLPFLFLYGNKGTGKSRALRLFYHLSFNAFLLERGTSAAYCDLFDRRGTGLIDQAEGLAFNKNADMASMLASAYTKETGKRYVVEIVKGRRHQRRFDLYGPKVLASFREPLFDLKDRLVVVPCVKAPKGSRFPDPTSEAEDWKAYRGRMLGSFLLYASEAERIYKEELTHGRFCGRAAEIFVPLAVMFRMARVPEERVEQIFEFFEQISREISPLVYDRDLQVLEALMEVLSRSGLLGFDSDHPVEVRTHDILGILRETGWEEVRAGGMRAYVEEIIRRNRALLRTVKPGFFMTTRNLVEKAINRLREGALGGGEREDGDGDGDGKMVSTSLFCDNPLPL